MLYGTGTIPVWHRMVERVVPDACLALDTVALQAHIPRQKDKLCQMNTQITPRPPRQAFWCHPVRSMCRTVASASQEAALELASAVRSFVDSSGNCLGEYQPGLCLIAIVREEFTNWQHYSDQMHETCVAHESSLHHDGYTEYACACRTTLDCIEPMPKQPPASQHTQSCLTNTQALLRSPRLWIVLTHSADRILFSPPAPCNHALQPGWAARRALGSTKQRDRRSLRPLCLDS